MTQRVSTLKNILNRYSVTHTLRTISTSGSVNFTQRAPISFSCKKVHSALQNRDNILFKPRYKLYSVSTQTEIDYNTFDKICEETLESLTEYFEELCDKHDVLSSSDVSYSGGVLTVNLGEKYGTYVINKQSPNKQIWLSSPTSGPKRYDLVKDGHYWIYKHDGKTLHRLLQEELSKIVGNNVDFSKCLYSKL